jgi:DNA-binding NtrC family response regulator
LVLANILIADDEAAIRKLLSEVVKKMGHTPIEAADGKEAFDKYKNESVDLSFIDIHMPEINGIDCLERVKEIDPNAVVIVMTGYPSAETIIETISDEGYTYLAKPLDVSRVMDLVERGLEFREARLRGEEV